MLREGHLVLLFICGVFTLVFGGFAYGAWRASAAEQAAFDWPTAPGSVVETGGVREDRACRSVKRAGSSTSSQECRDVFEPVVTYEFSVGATQHRGSRISTRIEQERLATLDEALDTLHRYDKGTAVTVHYDPADPKQAVLELPAQRGLHGTYLVFVTVFGGVGAASFLVALGLLAFALVGLLRRRRAGPRA